MRVSDETYRRIAVADPAGGWELDCGRLRRKPRELAFAHNDLMMQIARQLMIQLDDQQFLIRINQARATTGHTYYVPDVAVIPFELIRPYRERPRDLEYYRDPLPLVIEVWSPSTGRYDDDTKVPRYQERGDAEIWRVHPYERTVTIWRRNAAGEYERSVATSGTIAPIALPGVLISLDELWGMDS